MCGHRDERTSAVEQHILDSNAPDNVPCAGSIEDAYVVEPCKLSRRSPLLRPGAVIVRIVLKAIARNSWNFLPPTTRDFDTRRHRSCRWRGILPRRGRAALICVNEQVARRLTVTSH
jgi:hypothetical protein